MGDKDSITTNQTATLSPAARAFVRNAHPGTMPFVDSLSKFVTKPSRIAKSRQILLKRFQPKEEALITKHGLTVGTTIIADVPIVVIEPSYITQDNRGKIILNIHGGLFYSGTARDTSGLIAAAEWGIKVYSIEYTLSPEAQYPIARDECLSVYRALVRSQSAGAENIIGMATSAGGQLMLSMLLKAREERLSMPKAVFLSSPLADLSGPIGDSLTANEGRDPLDIYIAMSAIKQNYRPVENAGGSQDQSLSPILGSSKNRSASSGGCQFDTEDPFYSPIYASYDSKFPPTVITTGTRDLMLSTSVRLSWVLREAGVRTELLVSEGMWHYFIWKEELPEAKQAREGVRRFLQSL